MLVLGLDKFVEDLTEISGRAAKEFSLEKVCMVYSLKLIFVLQLRIKPGCIMIDTSFQSSLFLLQCALGEKSFSNTTSKSSSPPFNVVSTIQESLLLW